MAENEVKKEKPTLNISIWFVIFIVYLIFSLAYGNSLINENKALKVDINNKEHTISDLQFNSAADLEKLVTTIDNISNLLAETKNDLLKSKEEIVTPTVVEISTGVYSGSTVEVDDALPTSMTLTLSEGNVASLVLSGAEEATINGSYSVAENTVVFISEDALTTYSFIANENGSLKLVDSNIELTLSK